MNPTSAILIGGLLSWVWAFVAIRESARASWRKELRATVIRERNRNRFAKLRHNLMALSRDGHIDANSEFFFELYMALTRLLREPEKQMEVTLQLLSPPSGRSAQLSTKDLGPRAISLLVEVTRNLDLMCRDYHRSYRAAAWILDRLEPRHRPAWLRLPLWALMRLRHEKVSAAKTVREAGRSLERLAAPA